MSPLPRWRKASATGGEAPLLRRVREVRVSCEESRRVRTDGMEVVPNAVVESSKRLRRQVPTGQELGGRNQSLQ